MYQIARNQSLYKAISQVGGLIVSLCIATVCQGQESFEKLPPRPIDIANVPTLYVVGYSHLDTQWLWTYPETIREFIPNTLHDNFELFEQFPNYIFNFSGSRRYEMMLEYYPQDYERMKKYIAEGRWFPCGSSVDEGDAIVPSGESMIRQVLYGNRFFEREFGMVSTEFMLPDCFGFPAALPSLLAHCGIKGFSTQKLTWGSANGVPFKVGVWEGPDGQGVIAAFDPGAYVGRVTQDLSNAEGWLHRINQTGEMSGAYVDYHYYGTGDKGGAPGKDSVEWIERSLIGDGPIHVVSSTAEQMFNDLTTEQIANLPTYQGDLLLTEHSAGSITSKGYMKRWNRQTEQLADAAERASVVADWFGGAPYPRRKLYDSWNLVLGTQMHDMLPGTSIPPAYDYCWNDYVLAANMLAAVNEDAVGVVAKSLDTRGDGIPLIVYNPLAFEREDLVEATIRLAGDASQAVQVTGPDNVVHPAQIISRNNDEVQIVFPAKIPSVGFAVYHVKTVEKSDIVESDLRVNENSLENKHLRVTLDDAGDITSIYDKIQRREVLKAPARLSMQTENPRRYPAWNMDWVDRQKPPRSYVGGPAKIRIVEDGPVRVTLEVERETEGSRFIQRISLNAATMADRVEVDCRIDWQTRETSLKAAFPFAIANPIATYDDHLGVVQRGNNDPLKYEVPQHFWFDLTDTQGDYGVAVLNDSKYGSDKPDDHTMRLTLLYTPGTNGSFDFQATQDFGHHEIRYAVLPHAGDWREANVSHAAAAFNQPLQVYTSTAHDGVLGKTFSLLQIDSAQVAVMAIKKAEDSDELILRLEELNGDPVENVAVTFAAPVMSAREVNGQEKAIGEALIQDGKLIADLDGFGLRSYAIQLADPPVTLTSSQSVPVRLPYNLDAVSADNAPADGDFDDQGHTYAAEQFPSLLTSEGVEFTLGRDADGENNAVICRGQTITLPDGDYDRVYLLVAAINGDQTANFHIGDTSHEIVVQDWHEYIGQWDQRVWSESQDDYVIGLTPGYIKSASVAWYASHRHQPKGNTFYEFTYLFKHGFDLPPGTTSITLPENENIRVFALTVANNTYDQIKPATPLFDTLEHEPWNEIAIIPNGGVFDDLTQVELHHGFYWNEGDMRYTLDGSQPTVDSPVYTEPIAIYHDTVIRAVQLDDNGNVKSSARATFNVDDQVAPEIELISAIYGLSMLRIELNEPVAKEHAQDVDNYSLGGKIKVTRAVLSDDGRTIILTLDQALQESEQVQLEISGLRDRSGNDNRVASGPYGITVSRPVYSLDEFNSSGIESRQIEVSNLPVEADDSWTLNLFCYVETLPATQTILAGFGAADAEHSGQGRYIARFVDGVHFWSDDRDVTSRVEFDLDQWQMITATYDGHVLRLYKNAELINSREISLEDDLIIVNIAPIDPWSERNRFDGQLRDVTIWDQKMSPDELLALFQLHEKGGQ